MLEERRPAGRVPLPDQLAVSSWRRRRNPAPHPWILEFSDRHSSLGRRHSLAYCPLDQREDRTRAGKADLSLGRVDVDIDLVRGQPEIEDHAGAAETTPSGSPLKEHRLLHDANFISHFGVRFVVEDQEHLEVLKLEFSARQWNK